MTHCKNCNNPFEGKYCNLCGQKANIGRLDWRFIIHNIEHTVFHLEQGIFFTIHQLFTRPGLAIKEYIGGKRIKYTPPLSYLVITFIAFFFFSKIFSSDSGLIYTSKQVELMMEFMNHYYDKIMLILVIPLTVVFTNILFPGNPYNFFELFAFHCYMRGQFLLMEMVVLLLDWILVRLDIFLHPITLIILIIIPNITFLCWSLSQFFGEKSIGRCLLKTLVLTVMILGSAFTIGSIISMILSLRGIY